MISGKKVFITGGAGFIGTKLAERLVQWDNEIVLFDNLKRNSFKNSPVASSGQVRLIQGDVLDARALAKAMKGAHIVVHAAAIAGIDTVIQRPTETMRVNILGTANALQAAESLESLERVLTFSTSEVFGPRAYKPTEADATYLGAVGEARWTYAVSKLACEHLTLAYHREKGMPAVVVRPFNVYGPGQVGESAIHHFVRRAIRGKDLEVHGDGTQIRAWCYIDDMIDGIMACLSKPQAVGESFNIGNPKAVITIYGLANTVIRVLNSPSRIVFTKKDYVDVELRVPSVAKAERMLGFEAKVDLEEGIRRTAEYYRRLEGL